MAEVAETEQEVPTTAPAAEDLYDEDGKLTLEGMKQVIADGGSVMHNGTIYWRSQDLPKEEDLAAGNPRKLSQAATNVQQQIDDLQARLTKMQEQAGKPIRAGAMPGHNVPEGMMVGTAFGEGDTAGADGDASDPESPAGKKQAEAKAEAERQAEAKAKADAKAKAEQEKAK